MCKTAHVTAIQPDGLGADGEKLYLILQFLVRAITYQDHTAQLHTVAARMANPEDTTAHHIQVIRITREVIVQTIAGIPVTVLKIQSAAVMITIAKLIHPVITAVVNAPRRTAVNLTIAHQTQ